MPTRETFKERRERREQELVEALLSGESARAYLAMIEAVTAFAKAAVDRVAELPEDRRRAGRHYIATLMSRATDRGWKHVVDSFPGAWDGQQD